MKKISWFEPRVNDFSKKIFNSTIKRNFISEGNITSLLEKKISNFINIKNVIMTSTSIKKLQDRILNEKN